MKNLSIITAVLLISVSAYAEDPDYGSTFESAQLINADGTIYYGILDSAADEDWFYFEKPAYSRYRFTLTTPEYNWFYLEIYQIDDFGVLTHHTYTSAYDGSTLTTLFFELQYDCYMKVSSSEGQYSVKVEYIDVSYPDSYSDSCETAAPIAAGSPTIGILDHSDPENFDTDYFVFETLPLHKYQIAISKPDNSNVSFILLSQDCSNTITSWAISTDLISWFGESYIIQIVGEQGKFTNYYNLLVTDLGLQADDFANTKDYAQPITPDGQDIFGKLEFSAQYQSDEDWFVVAAQPHTRYRFTLNNGEHDWKYLYVYFENAFGDLVEQVYTAAYNGTESTAIYCEAGGNCFVRVAYGYGDYSFKVEYIDTVLPDSYGDDCSAATVLYPGEAPTAGILDHAVPDALDTDWFVFNTQPLHKYEITLTQAANSDTRFAVYAATCSDSYTSWAHSFSVVSWFGESYKIEVSGEISRMGQYYTIQVADLGLQDDDWPNTFATAAAVVKDGSWVSGALQYWAQMQADEDWFSFTAAADGNYEIKLKNINPNWKFLYLYRVNEVGEPIEISYIASYGGQAETLNEYLYAGLHYLKIGYDLGDYQLSVLSPEARCGDIEHPYPVGDVNKDCYVNIEDIADMAANWLQCTNPNPPCEYGY